MKYIDLFLSDPNPKELSALEKITLSYEMAYQLGYEIFGKGYRHRITEEYFPEDKLVRWIGTMSQSYIYGFLKKYFSTSIEGAENIPEKTGALIADHH